MNKGPAHYIPDPVRHCHSPILAAFATFSTTFFVTTFIAAPLALTFYPCRSRLGSGEQNDGIADGASKVGQRRFNHLTPTFSFSIVPEQLDHVSALFGSLYWFKHVSISSSYLPLSNQNHPYRSEITFGVSSRSALN
jgi:hypothetical protein